MKEKVTSIHSLGTGVVESKEMHTENSYIVYPSWATLSYAWEDLPTLFRNPLSSGHLDKSFDWESYGWVCDDSVEYELLDGAFGGGIIRIAGDLTSRVPVFLNILTSKANVTIPAEIRKSTNRVRYVEPYQRSPLEKRAGLRKNQLYTCYMGMRHIETASEYEAYWALRFTSDKMLSTELLERISTGIAEFSLDLEAIDKTDADILRLEDCAQDDKCSHHWFRISGPGEDSYLRMAVSLYVSYYLAQFAGRGYRGALLLT